MKPVRVVFNMTDFLGVVSAAKAEKTDFSHVLAEKAKKDLLEACAA
jgi:hypothetical protein